MPNSLLAVLAAVVAGVLAGCSNVGIVAPSAATADRATVQPAAAAVGVRLASAILDDHQLSGTRGGLSTGSGLVMTFSFQEATYVNHNLIQSIVVPTITVSPGSFTGATTTASSSAPIANVTSVQASSSTPAIQSILNDGTTSAASNLGSRGVTTTVSSATAAIQSILNGGMTSVASNLSGGGITSTISNSANNQLIQQLITANVGISGLSQAIRQNVPAMVTTGLAGANSAFR